MMKRIYIIAFVTTMLFISGCNRTKAKIENYGECFSINGKAYTYCSDLEDFTVTEKLIGKKVDGMKIYMIEEYPDYEYVVGYYAWDGEIYKRIDE